jgi:putative ABC transport system substrate-binding protein
MSKKTIIPILTVLFFAFVFLAQAQQSKVYRVGVILEGGGFYAVVDGLKDGLRALAFEEGKHFQLEIRDLEGDRNPKTAEDAARSLERQKINLIYVVGTSRAIAAKRATTEVPIVFAVGSDPVAAGLVESFAKPGGRLTGVYYLGGELIAKRMEILKAILPKLRRAVTFYDPNNANAVTNAKSAREAARQLNVEFLERHVASVEELRRGVIALKAEDADAYFHSGDGMVMSQAQFIADTARTKKLPTMFSEQDVVTQGALAGYGVSFYEAGRLSATYVQRILAGTSPRGLPVESIRSVGLAVNLKTARELGLTIPQAVLLRADAVIQ